MFNEIEQTKNSREIPKINTSLESISNKNIPFKNYAYAYFCLIKESRKINSRLYVNIAKNIWKTYLTSILKSDKIRIASAKEGDITTFMINLPLLAGISLPQANEKMDEMILEYQLAKTKGQGANWLLENLTCYGIWKQFGQTFVNVAKNPNKKNIEMMNFLYQMAIINTIGDLMIIGGIAKAGSTAGQQLLRTTLNSLDDITLKMVPQALPFALQTSSGTIKTTTAFAIATEARISYAAVANQSIALVGAGTTTKYGTQIPKTPIPETQQFLANPSGKKVVMIDTGWFDDRIKEGIDIKKALENLKKQLNISSKNNELYVSDATYEELLKHIKDSNQRGKIRYQLIELKEKGVIQFDIPKSNKIQRHIQIDQLKRKYHDLILQNINRPGIKNNPRIGSADAVIMHEIETMAQKSPGTSFLVLTSDSDFYNLRKLLNKKIKNNMYIELH